jgi:cell division GTPase FtsZ
VGAAFRRGGHRQSTHLSVSVRGARGVLISITGGKDLTVYEVDEAANPIRQEVDPDANIIVGATFDESLDALEGAGGRSSR